MINRPLKGWLSRVSNPTVPAGKLRLKGFLLFYDSDTIRYVSGGVLNNPVTRASQSRDGGRIPRAGWLKQVWDSAVRGHGSEDHRHRANCIHLR